MKKAILCLLVCSVFGLKAQDITTDLEAYASFNSGTAAIDAGNVTQAGVIYGATPTTDRFGNPNAAMSFNGTSSYIDFGNLANYQFGSNSFTVALWMKGSSLQTGQGIPIGKRGFTSGVDRAYMLGWSASNPQLLVYYRDDNGATGSYPQPSAAMDTWIHIAMVFDRTLSQIRTYVNGSLVNTTNLPSSFSGFNASGTSAGQLMMGRSSNGGQYYKGDADEMRIYRRALNSNDITALYNYCSNSAPTPSGNTSQSVCNNQTLNNLFVTGTSIKWYDAPTGGNLLPGSQVVVNGATYYATQTLNGCESQTPLSVTTTINSPAAPSGSSTQSVCPNGTIANLTVSGSDVQWYNSSVGGSLIPTNTLIADGSIYFASQTSGGCEGLDRLAVTATINIPLAPTGTLNQEFCNSATVADLTANGSNIKWYDVSTNGTELASTTALTNSTYYASQTDGGCESPDRLAVAVNINAPAAPTGTASQTFCGSGTVSDIAINESNVTWYDAETAGNTLSLSTALVNGTTYYATQTVNGCESLDHLAVTTSINSIPSAPTGNAAQVLCNSGTIADLAANESNIQWYSSSTSGSSLPVGSSLSSGLTYYATQTINECESMDRLAVTVTINPNPSAPTGPDQQFFCTINSSSVAELLANGNNIQWYAFQGSSTPLSASTPIVQQDYYATQTINGCESDTYLSVFAFETNPPSPPFFINPSLSFCSGATIEDLNGSSNSLMWFDVPNSGSPLSMSTVLINGINYYASSVNLGCESLGRTLISVDIVPSIDLSVTIDGILITSNQDNGQYQWIDCNNNNEPMLNETLQSYNAIEAGSYAVIISLPNCTDTTECFSEFASLNENAIDQMLLMAKPNPVSDFLSIYSSGVTQAQITSANGALIETIRLDGETNLDVTMYPSGVYFIKTLEGRTTKFVKQ